ncbi:hypothetical protein QWY87_15730 [Lutimonas halocynthiae]|uniref:hypothetical protein n=1 Tax=Lutimonas halocynthiae TaxID=1446477 RepID=UPI0025B3B62C|nr:hypothetical protein [Lutimonas halocynthiae]MDN3644164.1 hypothetical protein [Lutimonas halocynthiae]
MNKALIMAAIALMLSTGLIAQERGKERIKAYRTAYITQELDLSSKEAEKFWPVYNEYDKKIFGLRVVKMREERSRIKELGGPEMLSDEEASQTLNTMLASEKEITKTREDMYKALSKVLSPTKLLKLYHAEMSFNKRLLSEFKKGKQGNK